MKTEYRKYTLAIIYGIVITIIMLLLFGSKIIGNIIENGAGEFNVIAHDLTNWYDNPTGFLIAYLVGYIVVWWKPFWGSLIIMAGSVVVALINIDNPGFLITAVPVFLVGLFYIMTWVRVKQILEVLKCFNAQPGQPGRGHYHHLPALIRGKVITVDAGIITKSARIDGSLLNCFGFLLVLVPFIC